jgi:hypothetical protein
VKYMRQLYIDMCEARDRMEKVAQSKWRTLIDTAPDQQALSNVFAEFNRNRNVHGANIPGRDVNIHASQEMGALRTRVKQFLSTFTQANKRPFVTKSVHELTPEEVRMRRAIVKDRNHKRKDTGIFAMDIDTGHDPEEWMPIIHGTNRSKAETFLRSGNGASRTDNVMNTGDVKPSPMGIMVHSRVVDRADHYASKTSGMRGGDPVVLTGEIQRKHLFPNPSRSSGYGDEYSIPVPFYDKIRNAALRPGTASPTEFM